VARVWVLPLDADHGFFVTASTIPLDYRPRVLGLLSLEVGLLVVGGSMELTIALAELFPGMQCNRNPIVLLLFLE